jgi:hypothetical protein
VAELPLIDAENLFRQPEPPHSTTSGGMPNFMGVSAFREKPY